jgi:hypothetical protein
LFRYDQQRNTRIGITHKKKIIVINEIKAVNLNFLSTDVFELTESIFLVFGFFSNPLKQIDSFAFKLLYDVSVDLLIELRSLFLETEGFAK